MILLIMRITKFARDVIYYSVLRKFLYRVDPNGTHSDFLKASISHLLNKSNSSQIINLLEFGTGGQSSRIMRDFAEKYPNIRLYSFENNIEWWTKHTKLYPNIQRHKLIYVNDEYWEDTAVMVMKKISRNDLIFAFIDSAPWSSRSDLLGAVRERSDIFLIHDVDYFPHNNIFGTESISISFKKNGIFRYGKLDVSLLGKRNYDDVAKFWVEAFPREPGYYTGPPTLMASDTLDVRLISIPDDSIKFPSSSSN